MAGQQRSLDKISSSEKGNPGGVCPLGDNGKVPAKYVDAQSSGGMALDQNGYIPSQYIRQGTGSGLNAELLDGKPSSDFAGAATNIAVNYPLQGGGDLRGGRVVISLAEEVLNGKLDHIKLLNIGTNTHAQIDTHVASTSNPHAVTKAQVDLGNCDNTTDANKPVSTAQQTALNGKISHSLATAANDVLVASGVGSFVKKTLAELKTILGLGTAAYTASTDYAVAAKGVTNGDSHDHAGGDGAQIAYSSLSGTPTIPAAGSVEPGAVSSSTSGQVGTAATFARSDHDHDLGAHTHADAASGGTIAHSALTGLTTGDPHTQYALVDGTRAFTGVPSCAVAPTTGSHLVNKTYADSLATGGLTGYVKADCSVPFTGGHIQSSGAYTGFKFTETGTSVDAGKLIYQVDNAQASLLFVNDAETVFNSVWTADRSGATPTYFTVTPPLVASGGIDTDTINGADVTSGIITQAIAPVFGQCRLTLSGSTLALIPWDGRMLTIDATIRALSSTGPTLATTSVANTLYYIYAYWTGSAVALEASTTAPAWDSRNTDKVKTGNETRTLVGMARTNAAGAWVDSATQRFVLSYYNRATKGIIYDPTSTSTTSTSLITLGSPVYFLSWDDVVDAITILPISNTVSGGYCVLAVALDGVPNGYCVSTFETLYAKTTNVATYKFSVSSGYHYLEIKWYTSSGTASNANGTLTASIIG